MKTPKIRDVCKTCEFTSSACQIVAQKHFDIKVNMTLPFEFSAK
jgi:hypothetical protein